MFYEGTVYRPPSEAESLLIQATIGCPHNKCTFCGMYKEKKFRIRKVDEIKNHLDRFKNLHGDKVRSIFFPDGNTIVMRTSQLEEIFEYSSELFPDLERITIYGSSKFIDLKKEEELKRLRKAGLKRLHVGLESGCDEILKKIKKGADSKTMVEAGLKVKGAEIELSEYILIGIGGKELSQRHAKDSANIINKIEPDFIRLRTYVPISGTPMGDDYENDDFHLLSPYEALRETKIFISNLTCTSYLLSDHISNYCFVDGEVPADKESMLEAIDKALDMDESRFRPAVIYDL